jgi:hypothetical protein
MGELIGSSDVYSTWGKFRAPLSNVDTYYGFLWTTEFPTWVGSDFNKEYRAGQFCYTEISFCYPPAYFVSEHGSMFRVIPYSPFGWSGAYIGYSQYYWMWANDPSLMPPQNLYVSLDDRDFDEMEGALLTSDVGTEIIDILAKTGDQPLSNQGAGWYAIEKLQPIT